MVRLLILATILLMSCAKENNRALIQKENRMSFTEKDFWRIQDLTADKKTYEEKKFVIVEELYKLDQGEIVEYQRILVDKYYSLYTNELFALVDLAVGISDESFDSFRLWLINSGEKYYRLALENPDSLGVILTKEDDDEMKLEFWGYFAQDVWKKRFPNVEFPDDSFPSHPKELKGENEWNRNSAKEIQKRFPKTWVLIPEEYKDIYH